MAEAFLGKRLPPLRVLATQRGTHKDRLQRKLRASLAAYAQKSGDDWERRVSDGQLIAVIDAIWYMLAGRKHSIYVTLLRPVESDVAIVAPPVLLEGHEDKAGWMAALAALPASVEKRICAVVCDGGTGVVAAVREHGWILQRCHFHLIAAIQNYLTTGPRSANRRYATRVLHHVQAFLAGKEPEREMRVLTRTMQASRSHGLRRVLSGLTRDRDDYHAYLRHPGLRLPTTSNSAESAIRCVRELMSRCRGFRSRESTELWLLAWATHQKTIRCRPKKSTELLR